MPVTVKWLKAEIKKECPPVSKMRKAELINRAEKLGINVPSKSKSKPAKGPLFWTSLNKKKPKGELGRITEELDAIREAKALGRSMYSLKDKGKSPFGAEPSGHVHTLVARRKKK
jgi:hypothetical protein